MRSKFRNLLMGLSIMMIGGAAWAGSVYRPVQTSRADGVEVRRGASWVSEPVAPDFVIAALGELTPAVAWRPGDPIREVPRQFFGLTTRPAPVPANPASLIDDLAVTQAAAHPTRQSEAFTTPLVNIAGQGFSGVLPPDPAGDIGSTHYIQAVNGNGGALYRIYDKSGNAVTGALSMEVLAAGGACASGFGDPIVLYDEIANRWLLTEFSSTAGRSLCIYLSQFADPTILQTWTRYVVQTPSFPDYPKYGVWPQAYYVGSNEAGAGAEIYALDRVKMLAGQPIVTQRFIAPELPAFGFQVLQPIDLDGPSLPPTGAPGLFIRHRDDEVHDAGANDAQADRLELFELDVDWTSPANSTLAGPISLPISEFSSDLNGLSSFNAFAQPSGQKLDPLREQVMFRPAYRAHGAFEQVVGNFTTDIDGADTGGVRWFELRRSGGIAQPWQVYQEGTVALGDHIDRWMGAIAVDQNGNIGLGYSAVRDTTHAAPDQTGVPAGLRVIGRRDGDPVDVMTSGEASLVAGNGSQAGERWGDYHAMSVDPADGCTFWFTGEYVNGGSWATRIGGLRQDTCGAPQFMLNSAEIRHSVCASTLPQTWALDLDVIAQNGFSGQVAFESGTLPNGVSIGFAPSQVSVPGSTTATLQLGTAVPSGQHTITLVGTSGSSSKAFGVRLGIIDGAVAQLAPSDQATGIGIAPAFIWIGGGGDSHQYLLQIARDPAFTDIVYAATVNGTTHVPSATLSHITQYYWRVQRVDGSCAGAWSAVRTFVTMANPEQCPGGTSETIVFSDAVEPAQLGWTVTELPSQGAPGWSEATTRPNSPTRSWFGSDSATATEQRLDTPSITIPAGSTGTILRFSHAYDLEDNSATDCWDGATLDWSTNNGSSYVPLPGASLKTDTYTRTVTTSAGSNPLGPGRAVWCGTALTHHPVVADLGNQSGQSLKLRFRLGSDAVMATEGWYVDDIVVKACTPVTNATATSLTSNTDPSVHGQAVTLTATVSGNAGTPTGTVEFRDGPDLLGVVALSGGSATFSTAALSTSVHGLSAIYSGDATYLGSSGTDTHEVDRATTLLGITAAPDPSLQGWLVTITAALTVSAPGAGTPTGNIVVSATNSSGCSILLPATYCTLVFDSGGLQSISASYAGDSDFEAATADAITHQSIPEVLLRDGFEL